MNQILKITLITLLWGSMANVCYGQKTEKKDTNNRLPIVDNHTFAQDSLKEEVYMLVDSMPSVPGFDDMYEIQQWFRNKYDELYPQTAICDGCGIRTKVYLRFIVEKDGSLSNIEVAKGSYEDINDFAIRLLKMLPKWNPGKQDGKPVRVSLILPVPIGYP